MKMKQNKVKLYAKSLAEIILKKGIDEKKIVNNFVKLLIGSGYEGKSKEILSLAEDIILAKQGKNKTSVNVAFMRLSPLYLCKLSSSYTDHI